MPLLMLWDELMINLFWNTFNVLGVLDYGCCKQKAQAASAQNFTQRQQAAMEITR